MFPKVILVIFILRIMAFDAGSRYLDNNRQYQQDSDFKESVYTHGTWKSFYQLKDAQAIIDPSQYDLHLLNAAIFFATNKMRESKKVKALQFSPQLRDAATVHTAQMIEKNFFDHYNRFTPALRTPEQRIRLFGITSTAYAENVDYNYIRTDGRTTYIQLAEKIVQEFYDSPPHRKNLLGKEFTHLGCAAIFESRNKQGACYLKCTQDFSADY